MWMRAVSLTTLLCRHGATAWTDFTGREGRSDGRRRDRVDVENAQAGGLNKGELVG